jgi:hypothetical protein
MIFSNGPIKTFFRALKDGVFNIPNDTELQAPAGYLLLIDNDPKHIVDNDTAYLDVPNP